MDGHHILSVFARGVAPTYLPTVLGWGVERPCVFIPREPNPTHRKFAKIKDKIKRVVVIASSIIVFKNKVTSEAYAGSTVAILGVLVYSLLKQHYEALARKST